MRRIVHIPIEKKHRELMSKLLVALELVSRGIPVIIGHSRPLFANAKNLPHGIVFFKGMNRVQHEVIAQSPATGHKAVACDEEAMGARGPLLVKDVWRETQPFITKVLCQGTEHRNTLMKARSFTANQLAITGNPRIDLLRPPFVNAWRQAADEIAQKHGTFILVNTDMSATNSKYHDLDHYRKVLVQIGWLDPANQNDRRLLDHHLNNDQSNMEAISGFVRRMRTAMPVQKLVLRPHPAEDDRRWRDLARETGNLSVVTDTEPVPWLMAARCLVHTGCTTGVEAAVLGTPAIALITDGKENPFSSYRLSNNVGHRVTNIEEAVGKVRALLSEAIDPQCRPMTNHVLEPFLAIDDGTFAFERVALELDGLLPNHDQVADAEMRRIPPNVDRFLKATFDPAAKAEGYSTPEEFSRRIDELFQSASRSNWTKPTVRDLDWGLYALLPKP